MIRDPKRTDPPNQAAILLIHGDLEKRQPLVDWLMLRGHRCLAVESAVQAVDVLNVDDVDAVLLAGEGPEAARTLHLLRPALHASQPVMVFGPSLDEPARAELLAEGAEEVVACDPAKLDDVRPADPAGAEFALRLDRVLAGRSLRQELSQCRLRFRHCLMRQQKLIERVRRKNRKLREMAFCDALTHLSNVRFFRQWLATQFEIARRHKLLMSMLMIDIDGLKRVNDTCGHLFGDYVLTKFAEILRQQVRSSDVVARVGGDEFAAGLVETSRQEAVRLGRRLLRAVASSSFECFGRAETITVSIGVSCFPEDPQVSSMDKLLMFADQAMYKAKAAGRNDLACWQELDPEVRKRLASQSARGGLVVSAKPTLHLVE